MGAPPDQFVLRHGLDTTKNSWIRTYMGTNKCTNINYFIVFINVDAFPYTCFGP